jgi:hypothetical protein
VPLAVGEGFLNRPVSPPRHPAAGNSIRSIHPADSAGLFVSRAGNSPPRDGLPGSRGRSHSRDRGRGRPADRRASAGRSCEATRCEVTRRRAGQHTHGAHVTLTRAVQCDSTWTEDRAPVKDLSRAAPGAETEGRAVAHNGTARPSLRDRHLCDRPSRPEAATKAARSRAVFPYALPSRFQFTLNQDIGNLPGRKLDAKRGTRAVGKLDDARAEGCKRTRIQLDKGGRYRIPCVTDGRPRLHEPALERVIIQLQGGGRAGYPMPASHGHRQLPKPVRNPRPRDAPLPPVLELHDSPGQIRRWCSSLLSTHGSTSLAVRGIRSR